MPMGRTRGTETSTYPQEKKTKVIPQVVASERVTAQTGAVSASPWLYDHAVARRQDSGRRWKTPPETVKARYAPSCPSLVAA